MSNDATFMQVFDSLVREHGCASPAHIAIARSLATMLTSEDSSDPVIHARAIANLVDLLPTRRPTKPLVDQIEVILFPGRPLRDPDGSVRPWGAQDDLGRQAMFDQRMLDMIPADALAAFEAKKAVAWAEVVHLVPPAPTTVASPPPAAPAAPVTDAAQRSAAPSASHPSPVLLR